MIEAIQALPTAFVLTAVFLIGLLVGSFLNVVILRLPLKLMQVWRMQCREVLALQDNGET